MIAFVRPHLSKSCVYLLHHGTVQELQAFQVFLSRHVLCNLEREVTLETHVPT